MPTAPPIRVSTSASARNCSADVALPRAERPAQADLAHALVHRDQHDVHDADAADAERERADEDEQHLQADGDAVDDRAGTPRGRTSGWRACRWARSAGACRPPRAPARWPSPRTAGVTAQKTSTRGVARVPQVARGRVGDAGALVVAREVVAHLELAVHGADDGEAHAVDQDRLADRRAPAEQLLAQLARRGTPRGGARGSPPGESQRPSLGTSLRISPYSG